VDPEDGTGDGTLAFKTPKVRVRSKPPARRVPCDGFTLVVDGEKYYPHVGEWVEFVPVIQLDTLLTAMTLQGLQQLDLGSVTAEEAAEVEAAFDKVTKDLARAILRWSWTNNDSETYPEHPTKEVLRTLSLDEIMWLVGASFTGKAPEEEVEEPRGEGSID